MFQRRMGRKSGRQIFRSIGPNDIEIVDDVLCVFSACGTALLKRPKQILFDHPIVVEIYKLILSKTFERSSRRAPATAIEKNSPTHPGGRLSSRPVAF
jgi:hypothetical protein